MQYPVFISCPKGLEYLLEAETAALGLVISRVSPHGVYGEASLALIYDLILWSRLANRIQIILLEVPVADEKAIYQAVSQFAWEQVFTADKTLVIDFHGESTYIRNTMFGAQLIKDGVVDYFRSTQNIRPTIDKDKPQIRIAAYLKKDKLTLSLDLCGYSLHQRGYRSNAGGAPLKENVAAAILMRARWPELLAENYSLQDPFCGAGTLVIEAAMMAANIAPGLLRHDQAIVNWQQHSPELWEAARACALQRQTNCTLSLEGFDNDPLMVELAKNNARLASVDKLVSFNLNSVDKNRPSTERGLLVANPPYGERLGNEQDLVPLYTDLGKCLHDHYQGWECAILTASPLLAKAIGLRAKKQYSFFNGAIECKLYCISLSETNLLKDMRFSAGATMFINRLKKNHQHLKKWASRQGIDCYRVYDADLPDYAAAIDIYQDYALVQEYKAPASIDPQLAIRRAQEMLAAVPEALGLAPSHVIKKERAPQRGKDQYQKIGERHDLLQITEGDAKLYVNLYDYLDTGLFIDHRLLRLSFAKLPPKTRFLNCFCYTGAASVQAALAGAITTNVDLSNTYLKWAENNFRANNIDCRRHQFIQFDCLEWLSLTTDKFDCIFLDPPSFSNSKRMQTVLDIQRDHLSLIDKAMRLLNPHGQLYFSTNFRQFKLAPELGERYQIKDISAATIDVDFKRNQRIHHCYLVRFPTV